MHPSPIRFLCCLVTGLMFLFSRGQNCEVQLENARAYYQKGELHLVGSTLDGCVNREKLEKSDLIEANRLLANASFNLDSIENGTAYLANILNLDLDFDADPTNVFKFRNTIEEMRYHPNWQVGIVTGLSLPQVVIGDIYDDIYDRENAFSVGGLSNGKLVDNVETRVSPTVGIILVKRLSNNFEIETGVGFRTTRYSYSDAVWEADRDTRANDYFVPVLINYHIPFRLKENMFTIQAGGTLMWLDSWKHNNVVGNDPDIETSELRTPLNYGWTVGIFSSWALGNVEVRPQFRYTMGLTSRSETITDSENAAMIFNDPPYVNYNARFNYFEIGMVFLKQMF